MLLLLQSVVCRLVVIFIPATETTSNFSFKPSSFYFSIWPFCSPFFGRTTRCSAFISLSTLATSSVTIRWTVFLSGFLWTFGFIVNFQLLIENCLLEIVLIDDIRL